MRTEIKRMAELTPTEMWQIFDLRVRVFVVEQNCAYREIDEYDPLAYHISIYDNGELAAYCRLLPPKTKFENASVGRVIAQKRGCGLGKAVMKTAINTAEKLFGVCVLTVEAQTYAEGFYESIGFTRVSEEYDVDGIPHILMNRYPK